MSPLQAGGRRLPGSPPGGLPGSAGADAQAASAPVPQEPVRGKRSLISWLVPAVPAAATLLLDLHHLGVPSLWRDEAYTIEAARRSPGQILALLQHSDAVHGAYYLGMHVVISLLGHSATAVRLPSVLATAVAAGFLAVLARRLAARSRVPLPEAAGVLAGLLYAIAPSATYYAQEARGYAIVTAAAVIATWLLDHALAAGGGDRRWWAAYAAAIAVCGLFNLLALLLVVAHAVTVLVAGAGSTAEGRNAGALPATRTFWTWAASAAGGAIVLTPLLLQAYRQRGSVSWLGRPGYNAVVKLGAQLAGSQTLVLPVALLIAVSAGATLATRQRQVTAALAGLPWLVLPPVIVLAVSQAHPVYDFRYVLFCLPAVALLVSDGLAWVARLAAVLIQRGAPGAAGDAALGGVTAAGAWLPSAAIALVFALALIGPQHAVRGSGSRPDNLRKAAAIVGADERPGDVVFYLPINSRVLGSAYPAPFRKLRDIALARTPVASATLNGTEVGPATLARRFTGTTRVWLVTNDHGTIPQPHRPVDREKLALLSGFRVIGRWRTGSSSMLTLFARR